MTGQADRVIRSASPAAFTLRRSATQLEPVELYRVTSGFFTPDGR